MAWPCGGRGERELKNDSYVFGLDSRTELGAMGRQDLGRKIQSRV